MTTAAHTPLPSLDDIVFEGRNKAYGAYVLRRLYGQHVTQAVAISFILASLFVAVPILVQRIWPAVTAAPEIVTKGPVVIILPPPTLEPRVAVAQPQTTATVVTRPASVVPTRIAPDEQVKEPAPAAITAPAIDGAVVGDVAMLGNGGTTVAVETGNGSDSAAQPAAPAVTQPFVHVEQMPEFMGGNAALIKYLQKQLHYPSQALRASIAGKVFVSFTVNADGAISDVTVLKGLGYGTDEEASRVIRQMPAWKPGFQNKHAVPVRYTLPITFKYE